MPKNSKTEIMTPIEVIFILAFTLLLAYAIEECARLKKRVREIELKLKERLENWD